MIKKISLCLVFILSSTLLMAQSKGILLEGTWTGTYGNEQKDNPYFFSFRFFPEGKMEVVNQNNKILAAGTYNWQDKLLRVIYQYANDVTQYECTGNVDAGGTVLSGNWRRVEAAGTKRNLTQSGKWILRKQPSVAVSRMIKDSARLQAVIRNVNPLALSAAALKAIRFCTELNAPGNQPLPPRAATNATTYIKINPDGTLSNVGVSRQPLSTYTAKMWDPGQVITVGFDITGGNINLIETVKQYAKEWELYANIKFDFLKSSNGMIRVGFQQGGSWSYLGREALNIDASRTTMNFGWLAGLSDAGLIRNVVLHEFGHALGFIHEHQRMDNTVSWDRDKVYNYYALPPHNWSRADVDQQIFSTINQLVTNYSSYDPQSIMHYPVPAELTTNGSGIGWNLQLSPTDKQFAGLFYPFPTPPPTARGTLKTGDDCDEIAFTVEYGVVQRDKVEIIFELGQQNGKAVTWWKQIGIPLTNNTVYPMEIQNHSLIPSENKTSTSYLFQEYHLAKNKGISFAKGKAFSIHTPLAYTWNVLPAIQGGCRIRLTWKKDTCP